MVLDTGWHFNHGELRCRLHDCACFRFFFSSRRRHTRLQGDWSSDVCSSDLAADGFIGCYNDKYYWQFWRPIAAIHAGDADGNPATVGDPDWKPLFDPGASEIGRASW